MIELICGSCGQTLDVEGLSFGRIRVAVCGCQEKRVETLNDTIEDLHEQVIKLQAYVEELEGER